MCALQIQAEHASTLMEDAENTMQCIEKYVTKQVRRLAMGGCCGCKSSLLSVQC
jgi:methionine synthase I (cobalamin-dependent)